MRLPNLTILALAAAVVLHTPAARGEGEPSVTLTVKATVASKYVWRGYDLWNDSPAFQPDLSLDLFGRGYVGFWSAYAVADGCRDPYGDLCADWDEHDYYAGTYGTVGEGTPLRADYDVSYTWYQFFRLSDKDAQEVAVQMVHPDLLAFVGPGAPALYWSYHYGWPKDRGGEPNQWFKIGLRSTVVAGWADLTLHAETFWDDGAGSFASPAGWSHVRIGAALGVTVGKLKGELRGYYQQRLKESPQPGLLESEPWVELTLAGLPLPLW
ncbi:MAG: hypothetical protein HQK87_11085 [Nitrospinae bacterium]|nr:hypothetical protein [Nitrospinota bacterium]